MCRPPWRRGSTGTTPRWVVSAGAPSLPVPPATWRPRTSCSCSRPWGSLRGWISAAWRSRRGSCARNSIGPWTLPSRGHSAGYRTILLTTRASELGAYAACTKSPRLGPGHAGAGGIDVTLCGEDPHARSDPGADGEVRGWLSAHYCPGPRKWRKPDQTAIVQAAAATRAGRLRSGGRLTREPPLEGGARLLRQPLGFTTHGPLQGAGRFAHDRGIMLADVRIQPGAGSADGDRGEHDIPVVHRRGNGGNA